MGYQRDRDQFIATVSREGMPIDAARNLLRIATTINRLAELACSSEAADRDRIPCPAATTDLKDRPRKATGPCICDCYGGDDPHVSIPRIRLQDWRAEQRAKAVVAKLGANWGILTSGDPRGYTLRVIPPSYAERNEGRSVHALDSIGVPARESGIRW